MTIEYWHGQATPTVEQMEETESMNPPPKKTPIELIREISEEQWLRPQKEK